MNVHKEEIEAMTKKDYVKFAVMLKESVEVACERHPFWTVTDAIDYITEELADILAADNGNFDRYRFYKAEDHSRS